ncbi:MAG: hypothetical protein HKN23_16050 [Verrucomicrobiales bacterium]|nr:hypothetical protein [Verrucomicrobiales bacterium]
MNFRIAAVLALSFTPVFAQEAESEKATSEVIKTGPPVGTELTPAMAYAPVGPRAGEEFDAAAAIGKKPGAFLFIHELTRNGLPVIRGLDRAGTEFSLLGFKSHTFLLSDDRTAAETKLKAVNGSLRLASPIVLSLDGVDGPGNYALNRKAVLSLILMKDGKVHKSVAFTDVNAEDEALIRELVEEVSGTLPQSPEEIRELVAQNLPTDEEKLKELAVDQTMQIRQLRQQIDRLKEQRAQYAMKSRMTSNAPRGEMKGRPPAAPERGNAAKSRPAPEEAGNSPKREGKPPEDPELNGMLRAFIRQDTEKAAIDEIFASIQKRASESDELHAQAVDMFKLMLSFRDRYGTDHAQSLAEQFLKEAAAPKSE